MNFLSQIYSLNPVRQLGRISDFLGLIVQISPESDTLPVRPKITHLTPEQDRPSNYDSLVSQALSQFESRIISTNNPDDPRLSTDEFLIIHNSTLPYLTAKKITLLINSTIDQIQDSYIESISSSQVGTITKSFISTIRRSFISDLTQTSVVYSFESSHAIRCSTRLIRTSDSIIELLESKPYNDVNSLIRIFTRVLDPEPDWRFNSTAIPLLSLYANRYPSLKPRIDTLVDLHKILKKGV